MPVTKSGKKILEHLKRVNEFRSVTKLKEEIGMNSTTLSRNLATLIDEGYLIKIPNLKDMREVVYKITQ